MKRKINATKVIFAIYCLIILWVVLFKLSFSLDSIKMLFGNRSVNLIPFYYENNVHLQFREIMLNVILFVPFGIYQKMLGVSNTKAVLYGFVFGIILEICQFVLSIGASDITDVISNTLGTFVGMCVYAVVLKIFCSRTDKLINILATAALALFLLLALLLLIAN